MCYIHNNLQGKVKFLTGGNSCELSPRAARQIRCDSGTDSTVWMKEDFFCLHARKLSGYFFMPEECII